MSQPTIKSVKILFARSGNICAFPGCNNPIIEDSGIVTGHICHIKARNPKGPRFDINLSEKEKYEYDNLILLCSRHHQIIDKNSTAYDSEVLTEMKKIHEEYSGRKENQADELFARILINDYKSINISNNSGNIIIGSPNAIQAKTINIKSTKEKINILPPSGTISDDLKLLAYVKHLIKRYNEFAGSDQTRKIKFNYGAIYRNIESNFGLKYDLVPINRADELIIYIQNRIDKTRQARINKGRGYKSYSTFEEFIEKHFPE
ncbi:MAG: HNH endonuclease [Melioribacteraceae bacterium]|nr:HNH endonuclease [Melioribacteraceae bacterium]